MSLSKRVQGYKTRSKDPSEDLLFLKGFYPPYSIVRKYDPFMFGKAGIDKDGVSTIEFKKRTLLFEESTGRCYSVVEEFTTTDPMLDKEAITIGSVNSVDDTTNGIRLVCDSRIFIVPSNVVEETSPSAVLFHAKRFNTVLRQLDESFPSIDEIDTMIERCGDVSGRFLGGDRKTLSKLSTLSKNLYFHMKELGY